MPPPLSASPIVACIRRTIAARAANAKPNGTSANSADTSGSNDGSLSQRSPVDGIEANHAAQSEQAPTQTPPAPRTSSMRRAQMVLTRGQRFKIATWMVEKESENIEKIPSKAVLNFPMFFRGSPNANIARALRYWRERNQIIENYKPVGKVNNNLYISRMTKGGLKMRISKTAAGRGRKRAPWVVALYVELLGEFNRLRHAGVKFRTGLLLSLARKLVADSTSDSFGPTLRDPKSGKLIIDHLDTKWVQRFMVFMGIVSRVQTGKLLPIAEKQELIDREVSFHLGQMKRGFESDEFDENCVYNADETHFVVDLNDGRTLAMKGDTDIKFCDVVSGDMGMTMMVMLGGGTRAHLEVPMMIFQNDRCSHPIQGVPNNVPGVCYRSGPKGWMDTRVFEEWLGEGRVMRALPGGKKRVLFVDNASGHKKTETAKLALTKSHTRLEFLPKNSTDLCQPADSFIIQKIKTAWRRRWDEKRLEMIERKECVDWKDGSGKLTNPGKTFYLKLAAAVVREVSNARDKDGVSYCRKAMIGCGMALNLNGRWEVQQLFPHLQRIIEKFPENFSGTPVADSLKLDGEVTESEEEAGAE